MKYLCCNSTIFYQQVKGGGTFTAAEFARTAYDKSGKPALYYITMKFTYCKNFTAERSIQCNTVSIGFIV